jgi:hypothetical protein
MGAPRYRIDEGIKDFATESQRRNIDAVNEHGSIRAAAKALGIHNAALCRSIHAAERVAALRGYSPAHDMTRTVPAPFVVRGTSTLYDEAGKPRMQWVKTRLDDDKLEQTIREMVAALTEDVKGRAPITKAPVRPLADLLAVYPFGDPHVGMYAWAKEAGDV